MCAFWGIVGQQLALEITNSEGLPTEQRQEDGSRVGASKALCI